MINKLNRIWHRLKTNPKSIFIHIFRNSIGKCLPDSIYLRIMNHIYLHKPLNLKHPQTFNEKLQWLKLYDRNPLYTTLVDKYAVKKWVADKIGEQYIIPTLGVWDKFEDIDFDKLPNQFVLKCTHDSGGLVICRDKNKLNFQEAKRILTTSLKHNHFWVGREWAYKDVPPRIIAEQYMEDKGSKELTDYKWFCFNGTPKFLYVSRDLTNHQVATIDFYDISWKRMPFKRTDYKSSTLLYPKPITYDEMLNVARKLSANLPFVRVDLYEINSKVYFSELTFYPCSGWLPFKPNTWDQKIGDWLTLPINDIA